jgi:hypothetical protein
MQLVCSSPFSLPQEEPKQVAFCSGVCSGVLLTLCIAPSAGAKYPSRVALSAGLFHEFVDDKEVRLIGVEAAGEGIDTNKHAATLTMGSPGVLHGAFSYLLQDDEGQIIDPHSISAGYTPPSHMPGSDQLAHVSKA